MKVAFPSKGRVDCEAKKIFVDFPKDVFIFVDESDFELYSNNNPEGYNIVSVKGTGLPNAFNAMLDYFQDERFLLIDDDLKCFYRMSEGIETKLSKIEIQDMLYDMDILMTNYNLTMLCLRGLAQCKRNKNAIMFGEVGWRAIALDNKILKRYKDIRFDVSMPLHNDCDFYLQIVTHALRIATWFKYSFSASPYSSKGGVSTYRTREMTIQDTATFVIKWGASGIDIIKRASGHVLVCPKRWKDWAPVKYWEELCV